MLPCLALLSGKKKNSPTQVLYLGGAACSQTVLYLVDLLPDPPMLGMSL